MTLKAFPTLLFAFSPCALLGGVALAGNPVGITNSVVVICRSDAGGPWKPIAKGSLKRTTTEQATDYHLSVGEHAFRWANTRLPNESMALTMPNSLIRALVEEPRRSEEKFPRAPVNVSDHRPSTMSLNGNGEIREQMDNLSVAAVIGTACPK